MPTNLDISFDTNDIIEAEHVKQFADPIQDLESGAAWYRAATGSGNAYVVDFSDVDENGLNAGALTPGQIIHFKANHTNTGAATLAVDGTSGMGSAIPITKNGGVALSAGDIQSGQMVVVLYSDESSGRFELVGGASALDNLSDVTITSPASGDVLQNDGAGQFVNRDLATAGIAAASHTHSAADITSGILAVAQGGTGGGTTGDARSSLGLAIGSDVQAHDAALDDLAGLTLAKGDLLIYDGSNLNKLAVGTNDQVLTADSAQTTGLKWSAAGSGSVDGSGTADYLPKWTDADTLGNSTAREFGTNNLAWGSGAANSWTSGAYGVYAGYQAGYSNSTGNYQIYIGYLAGRYRTGSHDVAIGQYALGGLSGSSTGDRNTAVGYRSGFNVTTSSLNVSAGYESLYGVAGGITGPTQVALGYRALYNASSGSSNVAVGREALFGAAGGVTGGYNTGVGYQCGYALASGTHNFLAGHQAAYNLTSGGGNVALGSYALKQALTGNYNVAIGYQAGEAVQAGGQVVAVGFQALQDYDQSTIGVVAIGRSALTNFNTAGASAVAVGYSAGSDFSGAAGGVMVGKSAGAFASGDELVAVGTTAGHNSSGDNIIAVGYTACRYAVGNENIGIGSEAVRGNADGTSSTGTNNIGLGHRALVSFTSGGHNLAMGYETGDAVSSGIGNTMLGSYAGSAFSTGNYNVCLGHRAGDTATGSNKLFIHASSSSGATPLIGGEFDNRNLGVNGNSYGSGQGVVFIADRVAAPSSNPTGGGLLYVEGGALKFRGSSGTVTTVASA